MSRSSVSDPAQRIELTERQEAVVQLIEKGLTNAEIAHRLGITLNGVKWHVREIIGKFSVRSREEAVARWQEQRSAGGRSRMWGGALWGSAAFRWASGVAAASGVGAASVALAVGAFQAKETPSEEPRAVVAAIPTATPDLSTNQGLALDVRTVQLDDTQTLLDVSLDGRPELGRLVMFEVLRAPTGPQGTQLVDDQGRTYRITSEGGENGPRESRLIFEPVPADAKWVDLVVHGASSVAPAAETALGEEPPDPSATIEGPWRVRITELPRDPVFRHAVTLEPQTFGPGTAVPFEIIQTEGATLLGIRFDGVELSGRTGIMAWPKITQPDGTMIDRVQAGTPPSNETTMWISLVPTHGDVVVSLEGKSLSTTPGAIYRLGDGGPTLVVANPTPVPAAEEARAALEALLATQSPPEWTFTIP